MKTINKIKFNYMHFSYQNFTVENFKSGIIKNFKLNTTYSILIKISCNDNNIFKMSGSQIGLIIKDKHDLLYYDNIYSVIISRIESTLDMYNYIEKVDLLEISYSAIIPQKELELKNIQKVHINKQVTNPREVKLNFNQNLLPLTTDTSYFGYPATTEERTEYIKLIENTTQSNLSTLASLL
jgi:hypothetical protein